MTATRSRLKSQAELTAWLTAVATIHGEPMQHLAYPEDCAEIVHQFAEEGVVTNPAEVQAFWYAYCKTMGSGWMKPFADCVGVLNDLASEIEAGDCLDDSLAKLRGSVLLA